MARLQIRIFWSARYFPAAPEVFFDQLRLSLRDIRRNDFSFRTGEIRRQHRFSAGGGAEIQNATARSDPGRADGKLRARVLHDQLPSSEGGKLADASAGAKDVGRGKQGRDFRLHAFTGEALPDLPALLLRPEPDGEASLLQKRG